MKNLIERDDETGVELMSEVRTHPRGGDITVYSVWLVAANGKRGGISGFEHSDKNQAMAVFNNTVQSEKATKQ